MSAASAHHREVLAYVAELGGEGAWVECPARGAHPRVRFALAGNTYSVVIGSTPSDGNAIWMARRYIRRTIGLERGRVVGIRRPDRVRVPRPERLIQLAPPLPDWHDTLRRHPLYQPLAAEAAA